MNLKSLIQSRVAKHQNKAFLFYKDESYTYEQLDQITNRVAGAFRSAGITKESKVAIMLSNCPEFIFVWFGLAKLGAATVLINTQLSGNFLRHQFTVGNSEAVVIGAQFRAVFNPIVPELGDLKKIVYLSEKDQPGFPDWPDAVSFWDWINAFPDAAPPDLELEDDHPISIMFTSGTTGPSKGVLNGQKAYIRCGADCAELLQLNEQDRCYVVLPLYHGNPQMMAVMSALWIGGSLALAERFSASRFFEEARKYQATYFTYVGTVLSILCKQPEKPDDGDNPLRLGFGGGAPKNEWRIMEERFKIKINEAYGMIEAGCVTTINPKGKERYGSVGKQRDCFEIRIANERDESVPCGEVGEILVRPREPFIMFDGFYNMPESTLESYRNLWFHTGDKARIDEDGYFYFEGRVKDTIRRKGENISSEAIEQALNAYPKVLESAVVGVPDDIAGEEIKAYVIPKEDEVITPEELIDWCREGLPGFMVPRYIEFRKQFEKTGSEKIRKFKLKKEGIGDAWDLLENK